MRRSEINTYVLLFWFVLCGILSHPANAQLSGQVKKFLWEKDFQTLIRRYGEEQITIRDAGDRVARLRARSYVEKPGLRVQVFAGTDRESARRIAEQVQAAKLDSVYILQQNHLFKVQVGNFRDRREAEVMLDRLRYAGISNAWIVESTIHLPRSRFTSPDSSRKPVPRASPGQVVYSIQLFVSGNPAHARSFRQKAANILTDAVWLKQQGNLWKVMAGKFVGEHRAREKLAEIREAGFTDAWLTQVEIDEGEDFR